MLCKLLPSSTIPLHFKRFSSISTLSSPSSFLRTLKHTPEQNDPSRHHITSLKSGRFAASLEVSEATYVVKSSSTCFISNALKISAKMGFLPEGKQLHSHIIKLGYDNQQSLLNQLLSVYVKCEAFIEAWQVFGEMPNRNIVSWNVMISGFPSHGHYVAPVIDKIAKWGIEVRDFGTENLALLFFKKMLIEMLNPNHITFLSVLGACIGLNDIESGKQVHCLITKLGFDLNCFVVSALVDLYAKCRFVEDAHRVFDIIESRDLVLWNVMVSCYALNGLGREAFGMYELMKLEGIIGDDFTFSSLLNSSSISGFHELGRQIHGCVIRSSFDLDILVSSALVDMYAKNGNIEDARKAFDVMVIRNIVSWTTMIVGYGLKGDGKEAVELFRQMLREGLRPDELTLASLLSLCASMAACNESIQLHAHVMTNGLGDFLSVENALITAYAKCGNIASAYKCFSLISKPDIISWTSMISAYAFHGLAREGIETFEKMLHEGVKPDRVTFVGILSACSHSGLVDEGLSYFNSMRRDHHIIPDSEHYTCLVDLLGRAGKLDQAYNILTNMPLEPGANVLGAFVGACKVHNNIKLAKWAADKLFAMEPDESVNYMLVSNLYAAQGSWVDVARVRKMMRNNCVNKVPGCSWTEISGKVHTFVSNDKSHPQTPDLYDMLDMLLNLMKDEGYMYNTNFCFSDVQGEPKNQLGHLKDGLHDRMARTFH